jgi:hypothetical protein
VLEGNTSWALIEASIKEEAGQHVHGWESIILPKEEVAIKITLDLNFNFYLIGITL